MCTWNQRLIFFDIETFDNLSLWAKLIDLDRNQEVLGEVRNSTIFCFIYTSVSILVYLDMYFIK